MKRLFLLLLVAGLFAPTMAFAGGESCCKPQAACCQPAQECCTNASSDSSSETDQAQVIEAVIITSAQAPSAHEARPASEQEPTAEADGCCAEGQPCCVEGADCCSAG
jgi:hypothetical protein